MNGTAPEDAAVAAAVAALRERVTRAPQAVLVLGSGLGGMAGGLGDALRIPYASIPGFPRSTVQGHGGALVVGIWEGREVAAMQGRFHLYEGWSPDAITLPLRALRALGAELLVLSNSAGAIRPTLRPGDLMLIDDHINWTFRGFGAPRAAWRFERGLGRIPYDPELGRIAREVADQTGVALVPGIYAAVHGPSYETPAEIRMLARMGADAVGMSTVPEAVAGASLGMRVVGISCITNAAPGLRGGPLTHEEVLEVAGRASERLMRFMRAFIPRVLPANLATEAAE